VLSLSHVWYCKPAVGILEGFQAWQMWSRVQPGSS